MLFFNGTYKTTIIAFGDLRISLSSAQENEKLYCKVGFLNYRHINSLLDQGYK